jgi:hypothetical protein
LELIVLKVIEHKKSEVAYPVGRRFKSNGMVVIFWSLNEALVVGKGESEYHVGYNNDTWHPCMDYSIWEPVDIEIIGAEVTLGDSTTKDKIEYPIAKKDRKEGYIALFTCNGWGVIAANNPDADYQRTLGAFTSLRGVEDPKWEPVNLKIYG